MTTESEAILNRYKTHYSVQDSLGRSIKMRRLRLSEQSRILEFTENAINRFNYNVAASVMNIDGIVFNFPTSISDVYVVLDKLDQEGFATVSQKYLEINDMVPKKAVEDTDSVNEG